MYIWEPQGETVLGTGGDADGRGALRWGLFAAGLGATIIVTVLITRKAKAKLEELSPEEGA